MLDEEEKKENRRMASKKWKEKNKDSLKKQRREYYIENKEKENKNSFEYYHENKVLKEGKLLSDDEKVERKRITAKKWRDNNKDYHKKYVEENFDKISNYKKEYDNLNKEKLNKNRIIRKKNKYSNDINYRIKVNIRNIIYKSFKRFGYKKSSKTHDILGCSFEEFKIYLESKFEYWMTWENKGIYNGELNYGWDIDHIIPLSSAENEEDIFFLNHYTNLQPLCSKINRNIKKNYINYEMD
jgi:hypothetical protein